MYTFWNLRLQIHDFLVFWLHLQLLLAGQTHQKVLGLPLSVHRQLTHEPTLTGQQRLDLNIEAVAAGTHFALLVQTVGVDDGIGATQPFEIFAQMKQIPIHFNEHLFCEFVRELGLEVALLAVATLFGPLVLLLLAQPAHPFLPLRARHAQCRPQLGFNSEGFDVDQPPVSLFVLNEIANQFTQIYPPLEVHVLYYLSQQRQGLLQVSPSWWFNDCCLLERATVLRIPYQKPLVLRHLLVVKMRLVGYQEAVGMPRTGIHSPADECLLSVALHVFLESNYLVS